MVNPTLSWLYRIPWDDGIFTYIDPIKINQYTSPMDGMGSNDPLDGGDLIHLNLVDF